MQNLNKLWKLFSQMVENDNSFNGIWKNLPLGHEAFDLMRDGLPLRVEGELTPYTRIVLLNKMLDCMSMRDCARFYKEVQEYQLGLFDLIDDQDLAEDMDIDEYEGSPEAYVRQYTVKDHKKSMEKVLDYLDPKVSMEQWCRKYNVRLKFDPVERSEEWEKCIYDVEAECNRKLKHEKVGMGFCYSYWSTKKSVLAKHGIEWNSPSTMNPRVIFD